MPHRLTHSLRGALVAPLVLLYAACAQAAGFGLQGQCAGWPAVPLPVAAGHCVAQLAGPAQGLRFPRRMLEVAPGHFWLTDMGGWEPRRGRLLALRIDHATRRVDLRVLLDGLDRPHGLARGPDGRVYVGEAQRVWRTPVADTPLPETVLDGLPADGAHPLKELAFAPDGRLFVNIGSATDACRDDRQQHPLPCPEVAGPRPRAAVYVLRLEGPDHKPGRFEPYATGLRNSLALAWDAQAGVLWQGENSVDYHDATQPPEELNRLKPGANHGWPTCVGARETARAYAGRGVDCRRTEAPARLWPAHVAPLHMLLVPRDAPAPWAGQMLVAWHGHRDAGHRVVGFARDAKGQPAARAVAWLGGGPVDAARRPSPAGLALDREGRLYVLDDRHGALLWLAPGP